MEFLPISRTRFLWLTILQFHGQLKRNRQAYEKAVRQILKSRSQWMITSLAVDGPQKYRDHAANEAIVQFCSKAKMSAEPHKEKVLVQNKPNKRVCSPKVWSTLV